MPKGIKGFQKGQKFSEEHRKKLSISHKGLKFPNRKSPSPRSEEVKKKISQNNARYWKGKHLSEETKSKLSKAKMGQIAWNKGLKGYRAGKENNMWQGGISFEPYSIDWTETLKRSIRERDNYICQLCSQYGNEVHHKNYDKKDCSPENLITLCVKCHAKTNHNRNYWLNYFNVAD